MFQLVISCLEPRVTTVAAFVEVFVVCFEFVFIAKFFLTVHTIAIRVGVCHVLVVLLTRLKVLVTRKAYEMAGVVTPVSVVGVGRIEPAIAAVAGGHLVG